MKNVENSNIELDPAICKFQSYVIERKRDIFWQIKGYNSTTENVLV